MTDERPGAWVPGAGWVALIDALPVGSRCSEVNRPANEWTKERPTSTAGYCCVVRAWPDGTEPVPPVAAVRADQQGPPEWTMPVDVDGITTNAELLRLGDPVAMVEFYGTLDAIDFAAFLNGADLSDEAAAAAAQIVVAQRIPDRATRDELTAEAVRRLCTAIGGDRAAAPSGADQQEPPHDASMVDCWCWDHPDLTNPHPRRCPNPQPHATHDWWDEHEPDASKWRCVAPLSFMDIGTDREDAYLDDLSARITSAAAAPSTPGAPEALTTAELLAELDAKLASGIDYLDALALDTSDPSEALRLDHERNGLEVVRSWLPGFGYSANEGPGVQSGPSGKSALASDMNQVGEGPPTQDDPSSSLVLGSAPMTNAPRSTSAPTSHPMTNAPRSTSAPAAPPPAVQGAPGDER